MNKFGSLRPAQLSFPQRCWTQRYRFPKGAGRYRSPKVFGLWRVCFPPCVVKGAGRNVIVSPKVLDGGKKKKGGGKGTFLLLLLLRQRDTDTELQHAQEQVQEGLGWLRGAFHAAGAD